MVHATGVVINSFHCEGRDLPGHASDMLNATDIFRAGILDDFPYLVIALRLDHLPWPMQLMRSSSFPDVSVAVFVLRVLLELAA